MFPSWRESGCSVSTRPDEDLPSVRTTVCSCSTESDAVSLYRSASVRRRVLQARVLGSAQGDGLCWRVLHLLSFPQMNLCTHSD